MPTWKGGRSAPGNAQPLLSTPTTQQGEAGSPIWGKINIYISPSWRNKTHLLRYRYRPQGQDPPTWRPLCLQSRGPKNVPGLSWRCSPGSRVMNRDLPPTSPALQSFLFRDGSERDSTLSRMLPSVRGWPGPGPLLMTRRPHFIDVLN